MNEILLLLTILFPLLLIAAWPLPSTRRRLRRFTAWAPLPALLLSIVASDFAVDLPWLLFGSRLGLDATGRVFLAFTSVLWLAAGIYAVAYLAKDAARDRFDLFHLITMLGNLGVIVSQDMGSFLLFYTVMSLAAYGLIVHDRKPASLRAGRIYIMLVIFGEVLLFWAVLLTAQQTEMLHFAGLAEKLAVSPFRHAIVGLIVVGFGIKLGLMPLHVWLPLAHPAAPTPASAVLSGAIIKSGLLGMLRFLPLGAVAMNDWGVACIVAGFTSTFLAVLFGLTQDNPKTVLAYSSVSQMGLVGVMIGIAMMAPSSWPMISVAILVYAAHHAIVKASLFLGVGVAQAEMQAAWQRTLVNAGLVVAGFSLAGLPLTTGLAAKMALKESASLLAAPWASALTWILPLTSITTALLVSRFLYLVRPHRSHLHGELTRAIAIPWGMLTVCVVLLFFGLRWSLTAEARWFSLAPDKAWAATWPILIAVVIVLLVSLVGGLRRSLKKVHIPAGDLLVPLTLALEKCGSVWTSISVIEASAVIDMTSRLRAKLAIFYTHRIEALSRALENDTVAGLLIGIIAALLFILSILNV
ncbi:complex I subunit 5 family protein [Novipirellula caenicola]|uniref:NAD(P)H-quinone oxidoreductase subunit 2, chloroplastic n=1 Tax=Novipirellula caenicola TaxID=1536901 RepID=A0ABP9VS43_9BACT